MQKQRALVGRDVDINGCGGHLDIEHNDWVLVAVVLVIDFVNGLGQLGQIARSCTTEQTWCQRKSSKESTARQGTVYRPPCTAVRTLVN